MYQYTGRQSELIQIYDLYRTALLNVYYYGQHAKSLGRRSLILQVVAAIGSSATLIGILAKAPTILLIVTAAVAISSAVSPVLGYADKIAKFERLHFAYNQVFYTLRRLVGEIRSHEEFNDKHRAVAQMLFQQHSALGPLDETDPDAKLIETMQARVNQEIPPEALWLPREPDV